MIVFFLRCLVKAGNNIVPTNQWQLAQFHGAIGTAGKQSSRGIHTQLKIQKKNSHIDILPSLTKVIQHSDKNKIKTNKQETFLKYKHQLTKQN